MNLKIDSLVKKIGFGYLVLIAILLVAVMLTIININEVEKTTDELTSVRHPTSTAEIEMVNGINHSVACLRGWVLLEKPKFKTELDEIWKNEIRAPLNTLITLSDSWKLERNRNQLNQLVTLVDKLELHQEQILNLEIEEKKNVAQIIEDRILPINDQIRTLIGELTADHEKITSEVMTSISHQIDFLSLTERILLISGLVIGLFLAFYITRSSTKPIHNAVEVAENIAKGKIDTKVNVSGFKEVNQLGAALKLLKQSLVVSKQETEEYNWLSKGKNNLNDTMRGEPIIDDLCNDIISFITTYSNSSIGAIYLVSENKNNFILRGKYAFSSSIKNKDSFGLDDGIIAQVSKDQKTILLKNISENHLRISSSIVETSPQHVLIAPLVFEEQTIGVIELGKLESFTPLEQQFIEENTESIAIVLNSAVSRQKIQNLLEETKKQSEELQQQHEELEQSNEELEEQSQNLKQQQEELQASNEELEEQSQMIEEKNKDLEAARTALELKAEQLEVSSKYKSEFLANMSHELRTPLNSLLILSKDLTHNKDGNLDEEQIESAEIINKCGNDLLELINEILDLSKVEAGKMNLNISDVNIKDIVNSMSRNFKKLTEDKGIGFETEVDSQLPKTFKTDQQRLEQIIKNLVSNAIKFTDKGKVSILFKHKEPENLSIQVKDTGIGIPEDKLEAVFEAFQQADGSTSRKYGGTGLGLSISRELTKLLGGTISVESEYNKGSTFTLTVPIVFDETEKKSDTQEIQPKTDVTKTVDQKVDEQYINYPTIEDQRNEISENDRVILIIEDDSSFSKIVAKQAQEKNFKFIAAATGEDGIILAKKHIPDAIILDIELPGIDGYAVLQDLKNDPDLRHIPVHIISGKEKSAETIRSGAIEFLSKPVSKQELDQAFENLQEFISRQMKNLLIIEDNENMRNTIVKLIGNGDVKCHVAASAEDALKKLNEIQVDCIVLDLGLPNMSGHEMLKQLHKQSVKDQKIPPVIIYTGQELTKEENDELQQFAETIIVKGVKSEERLLDETALFLHRTVKNLPENKQKMITELYNKEKIFRGKTVLVVDDDMRNVFALSKVLQEKDMEVIKADNGITALEALKKHNEIDIVLMDIMMPKMDGYTCMKEIRSQEKYASLPIIAITAKAMKEDKQKCIDAGANDYISKPVDIERLFSLMRIWINH